MDFFKDRSLFIASMHGKEQAIAPLLEKELGVNCFTIEGFNTDCYGTFSGEIEREGSPLETIRKKCIAGMNLAQSELGIATEGSFGPHPFLFGVPAHEEILILIDQKNNIEITAKSLVTETNFLGRVIPNVQALMEFMVEVKFPSHGIILKDKATHFLEAFKNARSNDELFAQFHAFQQKYGSVYAETDMRAMYNPTRMSVIKRVCQKLIEKVKNTCPLCLTPGFDVVERIPGLPCSFCKMPTDSIVTERFACQACQHSLQKTRGDGKAFEDPMYCSVCNP
jgi:hypothetical protein